MKEAPWILLLEWDSGKGPVYMVFRLKELERSNYPYEFYLE